MATIAITNSQNSKLFVCATANTAVADATEIDTAITGGKQVGCLQDLGSIGSSRSVQEYSCLSSDDTAKSSGSITLGNIAVSMLFSAADTAGQAELRAMYAANETRTMIVVLNDEITPTTGNPTYFTFEGFVSGQEVAIQKDNAVMMTSTVEIASNPDTVLAS